MRDRSSAAFPGGNETDSDSELQRLRAEMSRYRMLIYSLTAVLVVFLLAGIIGSTMMANLARRSADELRRQNEVLREQAADILLKDIYQLADPPPK